MIDAFNTASGKKLPYQVAPRRDGDVLNLTADASLAKSELGWIPKYTLEDACDDLWRWTKNNPEGYKQQPPKEFLERISASKE
jgi:UDP-glucose 4-epimerase